MCERLSQRESLIYQFASFSGEAINDNSMRLPFSRIHWTYIPNLKKNYNFSPHEIPDLSDMQKDDRKYSCKCREHHLFISQLPAYIQNSESHKHSLFKKQQNRTKKPPKPNKPTLQNVTLTLHIIRDGVF